MNQISKQAEENSFVVDSLVDLLLTQKTTNIKVLKLESDQFHDNVIICTANSLVQMSAIIRNIRKNLQIQNFTYEGQNSNWLLISLKGILIQIFTEESREYYNIEDIYFDSETLYHYG